MTETEEVAAREADKQYRESKRGLETEARAIERKLNGPLAVQAVTPLDILSQAVHNGTEPAKLKELMDLAERWRKIEGEEAYARAMAECQAEMPGILKNKKNNHTGNTYANWESLNAIIRPIYTRHGFSLSFTEDPARSTETGLWMMCKCRHKVGHFELIEGIFPRDSVTSREGKAVMNALQGIGSTRSYAKRYLAKDLFALAETDEDTDGGAPAWEISEPQIAQIRKLVSANFQSADKEARFWKWLGCDKPEAMTQEQYMKAVAQYGAKGGGK